ncbi:carboxy terminal-processing peptidase [Eisenibacter elegans]|jgi:carboxyl-terminal processing protease|uniref:carboxy terminal-processing peptidase n=1 Tax=Eisenibacter elegans TaxID=997 RepID=UPI00042593BE|nr:carboxy terminal-processing peptidase [Eisenibacter elegans]
MKKALFLIIPLAAATWIWSWVGSNKHTTGEPTYQALADTIRLKPEPIHYRKAQLVATLLQQMHYNQAKLDDRISEEALKLYLQSLDNNKLYFLASDIASFSKYTHSLDNQLAMGEIAPAFEIYAVYQNRLLARINKILNETLLTTHDYTLDETYLYDRDDAPWAATQAELDEEWRKVIKNQALSLHLTGKSQEEIVETLRGRYERFLKNVEKTTSEDVFELYMNAFSGAYDPHSNYFSPISSDNFMMDMRKSLEGIGAVLRSENDYTVIQEVRPGGPAFKSNELKQGDRILAVAQDETGEYVDVIGWRIDEVVQKIRGPKGSTVRLQVLPAGLAITAKPKEVRLIRDKITLEEQSAQKKILTIQEGKKTYRIGVIEVPSFYLDADAMAKGDRNYKSTSRDVARLVQELQAEQIDGLLIDLRNNGGGSLKEAIDLTGLFVDDKPVVQIRDANGDVSLGQTRNITKIYDGPLGVIVNRFSASASEIFAAAIQDYKRGLVIGEETFGKGTVQSMVDFGRYINTGDKHPGHMNLTISKFYRITGSSTQNKGVTPDILFPSPYSRDELSEAAAPNALPWDEISPTNYKSANIVSADDLKQLRLLFEQKLKTDDDFMLLIKDIEEQQKLRERKLISLQEAARRLETEEQEQKLEARKKLEAADSNNKDLMLKSAAEIMTGFIELRYVAKRK